MKNLMIGTAMGAVLAAMAPAAFAQSTAPGRTDSGEGASVEAVVVTAQRREQLAQDVGISLSVLSGEDLARQGVTNVNQLQNTTPNLEVEPAFGSGQPQFRIRGVGFQDYAANNSPTVGIYVNEVAYPIPVMTQGMLFDIDRVEVLRGPQGTLYGRNTTGGAINFITGRPTADLQGQIEAEYGTFNLFRSEGYISGPLAENVQGRLAYGLEEGGGFQYNRVTGEELGDADRIGVRGQLAFQPTQNLDVRVDVHGARDHSEAVGLYLFRPFQTTATIPGFGPLIPADVDHRATGWGLRPGFAAEIGESPDRKPGRQNETWGGALFVNYDLPAARLTSITSYDHMDRNEVGDWDATQFAESDTFWKGDERVFSQELRLSSNGEGRFRWLAGLYYSRQEQDEVYRSDFTNVFFISAHVEYSQEVESLSGYGQAEFDLTDQLTLLGGLRYEHESRKLIDFRSEFGGAVALPGVDEETSMTPLTGKAELDWKPNEDVLIYASWSKGVKSGGFTAYNSGNESGIEPFQEEKLYATEVGFKTNPTRQLQFNGAAYYYDYRDQQVLSVVCTANGPVGKFANAKKSEIHGAELELIWQPTGGLRISQNGSWKKGEFKEFQDVDVTACQLGQGTVFIDRSGQSIKFPEWSYGGQISYDWDMAGFHWSAETDYSFHDDYPSWLGTKYDVADYWLVNASATFGPQGGPWTLGVFARNLFDEEYDLTRNFFVFADIAQTGTPRTIGARASYSF
ncbi:MAG TPA: TonB-dependent receptor [Caulobacteraceae bacterium]|jgi:outer membrane receptor protein involved in Fe transport